MSVVLLDTHVWVWSLLDEERLSKAAKESLINATDRYVSPLSLYEISRKERLGKWPEMQGRLKQVGATIDGNNYVEGTLTPAIAALAGQLDWPHKDPFDRLIAATAIEMDIPILSADRAFAEADLPGLTVVW